jgi:hypothetical protein
MLLLWWCPFKIQKEKWAGLQFKRTDFFSIVLTPLRIRWTLPLKLCVKINISFNSILYLLGRLDGRTEFFFTLHYKITLYGADIGIEPMARLPQIPHMSLPQVLPLPLLWHGLLSPLLFLLFAQQLPIPILNPCSATFICVPNQHCGAEASEPNISHEPAPQWVSAPDSGCRSDTGIQNLRFIYHMNIVFIKYVK